eukprot:gnl/TRDRNA2_/TRDRNA2_86575_c1_seq1.p1 gnl/TRDRNA2_/TRDRNA2_86575_c1~~gnl/TRDRNA2_/TRDRNA2_86575_c1_seq1.p1  ORF type:complete len:583 (-),score=90.39 gnl/TRDRNA2_/TRDRNA2_86575_c1_seq1:86-1807(-)
MLQGPKARHANVSQGFARQNPFSIAAIDSAGHRALEVLQTNRLWFFGIIAVYALICLSQRHSVSRQATSWVGQSNMKLILNAMSVGLVVLVILFVDNFNESSWISRKLNVVTAGVVSVLSMDLTSADRLFLKCCLRLLGICIGTIECTMCTAVFKAAHERVSKTSAVSDHPVTAYGIIPLVVIANAFSQQKLRVGGGYGGFAHMFLCANATFVLATLQVIGPAGGVARAESILFSSVFAICTVTIVECLWPVITLQHVVHSGEVVLTDALKLVTKMLDVMDFTLVHDEVLIQDPQSSRPAAMLWSGREFRISTVELIGISKTMPDDQGETIQQLMQRITASAHLLRDNFQAQGLALISEAKTSWTDMLLLYKLTCRPTPSNNFICLVTKLNPVYMQAIMLSHLMHAGVSQTSNRDPSMSLNIASTVKGVITGRRDVKESSTSKHENLEKHASDESSAWVLHRASIEQVRLTFMKLEAPLQALIQNCADENMEKIESHGQEVMHVLEDIQKTLDSIVPDSDCIWRFTFFLRNVDMLVCELASYTFFCVTSFGCEVTGDATLRKRLLNLAKLFDL